MGRVALLLLVCAVLSSGHVAHAQCGTVLECRATRAAIDADIAVQLQATRESIRATAEIVAEIRQATAEAKRIEAAQTAQAQPTATTLPTSTPQPTATRPEATAGPTATATATPLPTATERPSALDRLVDRILERPTVAPRPEGSSEPKTPWTTYFVWALLAFFVFAMLKVIFGQVTTILPSEPPQAWRNDDEYIE